MLTCVLKTQVNESNIKVIGIIVTLVSECGMSSHNSPIMYQNFKIVSDCALC
jgi:hypothetical protein